MRSEKVTRLCIRYITTLPLISDLSQLCSYLDFFHWWDDVLRCVTRPNDIAVVVLVVVLSSGGPRSLELSGRYAGSPAVPSSLGPRDALRCYQQFVDSPQQSHTILPSLLFHNRTSTGRMGGVFGQRVQLIQIRAEVEPVFDGWMWEFDSMFFTRAWAM